MKSAYRKYLNLLVVITLIFAPVDIMYANNSNLSASQEMVTDANQAMLQGEKCHQDMLTQQDKDSQCCCDSEANQCACVVNMTISILMPDNLGILNRSPTIQFFIYSVNYLQHYSTPLFKPPIA